MFQVWQEQGLYVITRLYLLDLLLRTGSTIRLNMNQTTSSGTDTLVSPKSMYLSWQ